MRFIVSLVLSLLFPIVSAIGMILGNLLFMLVNGPIGDAPVTFFRLILNLPLIIIVGVVEGLSAAYICAKLYKNVHIISLSILPILIEF